MNQYALNIFFILSGGFVSFIVWQQTLELQHTWLEIIELRKLIQLIDDRSADNEYNLQRATQRYQELLRQDTTVPANADYITCMGCGKVTPSTNGFDPVPHECEGIDHALIAK